MDVLFFFLVTSSFFLTSSSSSFSPSSSLKGGSSLSVHKSSDVLVSPNEIFTAGFHSVGRNAYIFAVWFTKSNGPTVIWTTNRDQPVNGKGSKLILMENGHLILKDAGLANVWTTSTNSASSVQLSLDNQGNLVLRNMNGDTLWQSFSFPTNTLLPQQPLTRYTSLVSSRSVSNYSSGFYKLFFDNNNVLTLLYDGPDVSSIYWPDPWLLAWDAGRSNYNSSKIAVFDSFGHFKSSDGVEFLSVDYGLGPHRRLTLDADGALRLYSLNEMTGNWTVTWQAMSDPCRVHGICGPNSICSYGSGAGRGCSCIPGYKMKNPTDWSFGCELDLELPGVVHEVAYVSVRYVEFYGYEYDVFKNSTLDICKARCLQSSTCKGFLFKFEEGIYNCYAKSLLLNGKHSPNLLGTLYAKVNSPRNGGFPSIEPVKVINLNCSHKASTVLQRTYKLKGENKYLNFLVWFTIAIAGLEILFVILMLWLMFGPQKDNGDASIQGYLLAATGFRNYSYAELKEATQGFGEEIGRGGSGVVYKGVLSDCRVAAVKKLNEANQGEAEFLAEVSIIGRINHMNLIENWGYCAERKHRMLVYEYMENGSLAENLYSGGLDWQKRFDIAVGSAKGLAYLHEECLEWVLHCDIKPENILLDSNYQPKIADFGLSKLVNRGGGHNSSFSRMRGTRGYMAPEWVFNLPITSKVDVYSYGIVVLEMITGRSPTYVNYSEDSGGLANWVRVRKKMHGGGAKESWIDQIVDPNMCGNYNLNKIGSLLRVALQCVEEDKDARPTMRQVVEMLVRDEMWSTATELF